MKEAKALDIVVFGIVQGVGFRPFVYRTARRLGYKGWVKNIGFGVQIHLEAVSDENFKDFLHALEHQHPPLCQIEKIESKEAEFFECSDFSIQPSHEGESFVFISPDISVCENCRMEMRDQFDRRYHYPFINCTDCGPRYTIVRNLPYDRDKTTMEKFALCPDCLREYSDPLDRRYHAQPVACPVCGPQVSLLVSKTRSPVPGGIPRAAELLKAGQILAVKGLGGFHLVCDAMHNEAVFRLRSLKSRRIKPLALMARDTDEIERYVRITPDERIYLESARRPIVLMKKHTDIPGIAPGLGELGFMLPYTPLHDLLLDHIHLIVATSSNPKDSPIMKDEDEGIDSLCDFILTHDRPIQMRADDSVMKIIDSQPLFLRRARGYVPYPQAVPEALARDIQIIALGGELKDTVSVYKKGYIVTSQFLGDLDDYRNYRYFQETIAHLSRLFEIQPQIVVSDLHPNFQTTRHAEKMGLPHIQVQHHFAHILAPLIEHGYPPGKKVLGVAWDGYGFGDDENAWGAEFLIADYAGYKRFAHFQPTPLPGGDLAAKQPWRMALAYLHETFGGQIPKLECFTIIPDRMIQGVMEMIRLKLNSPTASSCGRLFDAVSFLTGLAPAEIEFEAHAPMLLEGSTCDKGTESYRFDLSGLPEKKDRSSRNIHNSSVAGSPIQISFRNMILDLLYDMKQNLPVSQISRKFHLTLVEVILSIAETARKLELTDTVVLSGGVFLNRVLLKSAMDKLKSRGFRVIRPVLYSPNDESISIGQIAHALAKTKNQFK